MLRGHDMDMDMDVAHGHCMVMVMDIWLTLLCCRQSVHVVVRSSAHPGTYTRILACTGA